MLLRRFQQEQNLDLEEWFQQEQNVEDAQGYLSLADGGHEPQIH